jgi:hypothetical protein
MAENSQQRGRAGLTESEQQFCLLVVKGETQAEAYRKSFPKSLSWKDSTLYTKASTLAATDKVRVRIEQMRENAAERAGLSLEAHLQALESLRDEARSLGAYGPAVTAEVSRGKVAGLYEQRATVKVQGLDWSALLDRPGDSGTGG